MYILFAQFAGGKHSSQVAAMESATDISLLAPQAEFSCLSLPDLQHAVLSQATAGHDALRQIGSRPISNAALELAYIPSEKINVDTIRVLELIDYEPERIMRIKSPPKRFFRTFWRSMARRILVSDFNASMMR